jgi:hypothetical protein
MRLVTNTGPLRNHRAMLMEYASAADELLVMSPFLARDVGRILREPSLERLARFRLLTALEPRSPFQLKTAIAIEAVRRHFEARPDVAWSVGIVDRLHGKVYLFSRGGVAFAAIVSSANFTASGLEANQEWGIASEDAAFLRQLEDSINRALPRDLDAADISNLYHRARQYLKRARQPPTRINLDLLRSLGPAMPLIGDSTRVWLKPSGWSKDPVRAGDAHYAQPEVELDFSRKKPSGVRNNDLVIVYGVGDRRLMGLFEVTGPPMMSSEKELGEIHWKPRWPWHVPAKNLALAYSKEWSTFNLYVGQLRDEYQSADPHRPLTYVGGYSLGALNRGNDKIRLHPEFARFMLGRLWAAQRTLTTPATMRRGAADHADAQDLSA